MKAKTKRIMIRTYAKYGKWLWFLLGVAVVLAAMWLFIPRADAKGGPPPQCRKERAECAINDKDKACCEDLTCVTFNDSSGNGKCGTITGAHHFVCSDKACIPTEGEGTDECSKDKDCKDQITCPTNAHESDKVCVCDTGFHEVQNDELTCAPDETPKDEPKACTENCGNPPTFAGSSTEAPQCGEKAPGAAVNPHVYRNGDTAIVKWWNTEGNQAHIYYKQVNAPDWQYSVTVPNTGYAEIHGLGSMDISFAVQQVNGCSGGVSVLSPVIVDGASNQWVLFR